MLRYRSCLGLVLLLVAFAILTALAFVFNLVPVPLRVPEIVSISPAAKSQDVPLTATISVAFSTAMDQDATNAAITITPRLGGTFAWSDDSNVTFTPNATLPLSTTYTIQINNTARSAFGRTLAAPVESQFTTLTRPGVIRSNPPQAARFIYVPNRVTLTFNRAMNTPVLIQELLITPTINSQQLTWSDNSLTVQGFFQPKTRYTLTIPADVPDAAHGIPLDTAFTWSFTTTAQYPNLSILSRERVLSLTGAQPIVIPTQWTNVSQLTATVFPLTRQEFDANATASFETWYAFQPASPPLKSWTVDPNATLDRYGQTSFTLDGLAAGTYYLLVSAPEGVSDFKLLEVK